jgi:predicted ATPase/class 3 adenylate cyclase
VDVHLRLLGPLEVWDGRVLRKIGGPKERTLLTLLALDAGRTVSVDGIADALWGDDPPASATKGIPILVSRLRKALTTAPAIPIEIDRTGDGYRLRMPAGAVDIALVEDLARAADLATAAGELDLAVQTLARAESQWRGASLADVRDLPFAVPDAQRLDELRLRLLEHRVGIEVERGRHDAVLAELEAACAAHPLRERLWRLRMLALVRAGRAPEALRAFQALRAVLIDEVGFEPSEELRDLEAAILSDDPSLRLAADDGRTLPEGEITFLLTDIAGSTKLWERLPGPMAVALARHNELVDAVVGNHGGVVLKSQGEGDSTFSVFDDPVRAATATVELQRALTHEPWPIDLPVRVRMALHTGRAELRDGDYYGPTVNRAARLRAAGHGGQILVSEATAALVRDRLPDQASLRDLGLRRLKDLLNPERILQVEHADLLSRFPPLNTLDARPNNLPVQPTAFIGRDDTVATLTTLLRRDDVRLVTLTGPGGIGKTRLALRVAADVIDDFADGVWLVSLAAVAASDAVPGAVAAALGVRVQPSEDATEALVRHLQDRHLLLVLDNFEQVLGAADLVVRLSTRSPELTILATSREWLHLQAEREVRVEPLDEPTATRLFYERARAVRIDADDWLEAATVGRLCRGLDGLPLAIELVAARLRTFTLEELVAQLDLVLDLASDGPRDQPQRQRTLRDTVRWSIELLAPEERATVLALSVFRGGWNLAGAAAIAGGRDDPDDVDAAATSLTSLADKSLVSQTGPDRYDMVETVRAFAGELLAAQSDALDRARQAHRCHMARVARLGLGTGLGAGALDDFPELEPEVRADLDNLRAALEVAAPAGDVDTAPLAIWTAFLLLGVDFEEALGRTDSALESVRDETWRHRLRLTRLRVNWALGRFADVETDARNLLAGPAVEPASLPLLWNYVGIAQWRMDRLDDADASLERAAASAGDDAAKALPLHNRGLVAMTRGDLRAATQWFSDAKAAGKDDLVFSCVFDVRLAQIALDRGRSDDAIERASAVIDSKHARSITRAMATDILVDALIASGDIAASVAAAERLAAEPAEWDPITRIAGGTALAHARLACGDAEGAEEAATDADALATRVSEVDYRRWALHALGLARAGRGDLSGARRALTQALEVAKAGPQQEIDCDLAVVERAAGEAKQAWRRLCDVLQRTVTIGNAPKTANTCCYLADAAAAGGDIALAATLLGAAEALRSTSGVERGGVRARGDEAETVLAALAGSAADEMAIRRAEARSLDLDAILTLVQEAYAPGHEGHPRRHG